MKKSIGKTSRAARLEARFDKLTARERWLNAQGISRIAGMDEAGRGPLAGPVVVACVMFEPGTWVTGVDDSKRLSPKRRDALFSEIMRTAAAVGIGVADVGVIEQINILEATRLASVCALECMQQPVQIVFTDSLALPVPTPVESMVRADSSVYSVAAASIVAKVTRDRIMMELDRCYPAYGFARHKGYGTQEHRSAILAHGPCAAHRPTFLRKLQSRV